MFCPRLVIYHIFPNRIHKATSFFCGVVGLKPTFGLLSRHGLMSYASSFDCIGPVTSSVEVPFCFRGLLILIFNSLSPIWDEGCRHRAVGDE